MARVMFDPENDRRAELTFPRIDMRARQLREKQERGLEKLYRVREDERRSAARLTAREKSADARQAELERIAETVKRRFATPFISTGPMSVIMHRAMKVFGVSRTELTGASRNRRIVFARQFVMYWARRKVGLSLPQIGRRLGGRDHTTVLHGCQRYVDKRKAMNRTLRAAR